MTPDPNRRHEVVHGPFQAFFRTTQFWRRATGIYLSYKAAQVKAQALKLQGWDTEKLKQVHWTPHHSWAGEEMYSLCVDMRGFYLKVCVKHVSGLLRATYSVNMVVVAVNAECGVCRLASFLGQEGTSCRCLSASACQGCMIRYSSRILHIVQRCIGMQGLCRSAH